MSETLRSKDIDELLSIIECDSDRILNQKLSRFRLRIKLRRIVCFLLHKKDDSPSDAFFRYITKGAETEPLRIYPYRVK